MNVGDPVRSSLTLSYHLGGLHKPVLTTKNIDDAALISVFPKATASVTYIGFLASFNRQRYRDMEQPHTLAFAHSGQEFLARFGETEVKQAAHKYLKEMTALGEKNRLENLNRMVHVLDRGCHFVGWQSTRCTSRGFLLYNW